MYLIGPHLILNVQYPYYLVTAESVCIYAFLCEYCITGFMQTFSGAVM